MKLTFIRHSKTLVEPDKPIVLWGLSAEGIEKARVLSRQLAVRELDVLYSSCQTKAIETMVYLAKPNAIPMRTHPDLTEITSFTNKFITGEEYTTGIADYYARKIDRIAGGETVEEALGRFTAALEAVMRAEPSARNIGVVTHGYMLSFFSGARAGAETFELHRTIKQPDVAVFDWGTHRFERWWGELGEAVESPTGWAP